MSPCLALQEHGRLPAGKGHTDPVCCWNPEISVHNNLLNKKRSGLKLAETGGRNTSLGLVFLKHKDQGENCSWLDLKPKGWAVRYLWDAGQILGPLRWEVEGERSTRMTGKTTV